MSQKGEAIAMNADQQQLIMEPTVEYQLDIEEQLIDTDSYGEPVIARTRVTVEEILSKVLKRGGMLTPAQILMF